MKNLNSINGLNLLDKHSMSLVKGGATISEIDQLHADGIISNEFFETVMDSIATGKLDPRSLEGEWWATGTL